MDLQISASGTRADVVDALSAQIARAIPPQRGERYGFEGASDVAHAALDYVGQEFPLEGTATVEISIRVSVIPQPDSADVVTVPDAPAEGA